jgi:hypothetical protein
MRLPFSDSEVAVMSIATAVTVLGIAVGPVLVVGVTVSPAICSVVVLSAATGVSALVVPPVRVSPVVLRVSSSRSGTTAWW